MKNKKAALFIRVSTKEQADEGSSIDAQKRLLRDYSDRKNLIKSKIVEVSESARGKQERKAFNELVEYLYSHPDVKDLICEKVDRITRNFKDAIKLNDWLDADDERRIHFVKQSLIIHKNSTSNDKFQWDIYLVMARQYSNNLSEESKKGLYERATQGYYPGNQKRGYKTIGEVGRKSWVIDEDTKEHRSIKKAFELYDTGNFTLRTLSLKMGERGWKDSKGKNISTSTLHKLLSDCFYCGEFTFGGNHYPNGKHEALISPELFYRVQDRLSRKNKAGKFKKHSFIFGGGLLQCGECGRTITAEEQKKHHYYHCTRHETDCTQTEYVREELLEKLLTTLLEGLNVKNSRLSDWIKKAIKENHKEEVEYHTSTITHLDAEYKRVQDRLDIAYDDKLDGLISKEQYESARDRYEKQLKEIVEAKAKHTDSNIDYLKFGMNIFELSQKAAQLYEKKATQDDKRQLLSFIFSNLELKDGNIVPTYHNGFQLVANRAKSGNWLGGMDTARLRRAQFALRANIPHQSSG